MEKTRAFFEKDTRELIKRVTGFDENDENFSLCLNFALTNFVSHQYIDESWFKTKDKINGFCEKFYVQNKYEEADSLNSLFTDFLTSLDKLNVSEKTTYYAVLSLLTHLSGSVKDKNGSVFIDSENGNEEKSNDDIDWGTYFKEKYVETQSFSPSDTESWTESDSDSLASDLHLSFPQPPPSTDSGIEITPDSTHSSYPPLKPFKPYREPGSPKKPVIWPKRYWQPQYQTTKLPLQLSSSVPSFTRIWEKHLAEKDPAYTPGSNLVFSEGVVIREMLWMLNGIKETYLFEWKKDHFTFKNHIHLSHLTEKSLQAILTPLCKYGDKAVTLREFSSNVSHRNKIPFRSQILEAYAYGIEYFLNQYSSQLTAYEHKTVNQEETVSILQISVKLKPHLDKLDFLHHIHTSVMKSIPPNCFPSVLATVLLDTLWKLLYQHGLWMTDSHLLQIIFILFLISVRPYVSMIESLTMRGHLADAFSEFFIIRNNIVTEEDVNFWSSVLSLRNNSSKQSLPHFFLQPSFEKCLCAGRSVEVLRRLECFYELEKFTDVLPDHLFTQFLEEFQQICDHFKWIHQCEQSNDFSGNLQHSISADSWFSIPAEKLNPASKETSSRDEMSQHLECQQKVKASLPVYDSNLKLCEKVASNLQPVSLLPLSSALKECLFHCIDMACHNSNAMLLNALKEKHDLMKHLAVMKKYFLMEAGDVMFTFYIDIFNKIFDSTPWQKELDLNSTLRSSIFQVDAESAERLLITVENVNEDEKAPLKQLKALCINYKVDWPITLILSQEVQDGYCQIFQFLLQIKCAKYSLDELYCNYLDEKKYGIQQQGKILNHKKHPSNITKCMHIMRMKLLHFVNGFHSYVMTRILHSSGIELKEKLHGAKSIDDILKSHHQYLHSLFERCLLDSKLPYLREQIQRVLNLTLKFQSIWRAGMDGKKVWIQDLKEIEDDFSASINFLTSYLNKKWRTGENLDLDALASSILTDTHSMHLFSSEVK